MSRKCRSLLLLPMLVVSLLAAFLPVGVAQSASGDLTPGEVCWLGSQVCPENLPPPDLLGDDAYAAMTPEQATAVRDLERKAVKDVIAMHMLASSDVEAVRTWGRSDAQFALFRRLMVARELPASERTTTEQLAVDWLGGLVTQRAVRAVRLPGAEYARWAGLDVSRYWYLVEHGADQAQLTAFLSQDAVPYDTVDPAKATGGYCTYAAPAPFEAEYSSKTAQVCFTPCTGIYLCAPAPPTYDELVRWAETISAADGLTSQEYTVNAALMVVTGGYNLALLGTGLAEINQYLIQHTAAEAAEVTAEAARVAERAARIREADNVVAKEVASQAAKYGDEFGDVKYFRAFMEVIEPVTTKEATVVGETLTELIGRLAGRLTVRLVAMVADVIGAIIDAVMESIRLADIEALPRKLAALATSAPTEDTAGPVAEATVPTYFTVFVEAILPVGRFDIRCDNSDPQIAAVCLNQPPAINPTETDPIFHIRDYDANPGEPLEFNSPTITLAGTTADRTRTVRVTRNWFTQQGADSDLRYQSLNLGYLDWTGDQAQSAWLIQDTEGNYTFAGAVLSSDSAGPDACRDGGTCWAGPFIRYRGPDGHRYEARLERFQPPAGTPSYGPSQPVAGSVVALRANGFAPADAVEPITYGWQIQRAGCGLVACLDYSAAAGDTALYTWQTNGSYNVNLTAVDAQGRRAATSFRVPVDALPPTITLDPTQSGTTPPVGTPLTLRGTVERAGTLDNITVRINWGDGSPTVTSGFGPNEVFLPTPDLQLTASGRTAALTASHAYARAGTYQATITATNWAGQTTTAAVAMTVQPVPA